MKTLLLELNRTLLVVDPNENGKLAVLNFSEYVVVNNLGTKTKLNIKTSEYDFVCRGGELSDEIVSTLVKSLSNLFSNQKGFRDYTIDRILNEGSFGCKSALDSFRSSIESKGYHWLVNPHQKRHDNVNEYTDMFTISKISQQWQEAESHTFKNECLIFIKK